jgi:MFS family permease
MKTSLAQRLPFHYGWIITITGTLVIFSCLGLGRFALGMLLPAMGVSLSLDYAEMGFISTGNFIGYFLAVLFCAPIARKIGARATIALSLFLVGASMILVSRAEGFIAVLLLYILTGMGSGGANVPMMGLISHWFSRKARGKSAGFIVIGSGFAIVFSGAFVPAINQAFGVEGWRISWMTLGAISLAVAATAALLLRNKPDEFGLRAVGAEAIDANAPAKLAIPFDPQAHRRILAHLGGIYFFFGYTYVIYATFIVTTLVKERGFPEATAGQFWSWVGLLSLFSGPVFGMISDKLGRKTGLISVFILHGASYLLVALPLPTPFLYLSIGLFGFAAWSIPGIMAAAVGDYMGPERAVSGFGAITLFFGAGQIVGPALAGMLAETQGSFASSYMMAAVMAALAIVLTAFLPKPSGAEHH